MSNWIKKSAFAVLVSDAVQILMCRFGKSALAGLTVGLLCGCTVNIYQNKNSENLFTGSPERQSNEIKPITENKPGESRANNATAAEVMLLSTTPRGVLVSSSDSITLEVMLNVDAYVSCYYQQDDGNIIKLFPNRIIPLYRLESGQVLRIPGANSFRVLTGKAKITDGYMCLASGEDVTPDLPIIYQANAFQQVPVNDFDNLFKVYRESTPNNLVARVIEVPVEQ